MWSSAKWPLSFPEAEVTNFSTRSRFDVAMVGSAPFMLPVIEDPRIGFVGKRGSDQAEIPYANPFNDECIAPCKTCR